MPSKERLDEAVEWFKTSLDGNRLAHAYVIVGSPRGDAFSFALRTLSLLYDGDESVDPTKHPDVLWVEPTKKSNIISVEQIRDVRRRMSHTSFVGGWKACVVIQADRLGVEASNAFLKTLEEPSGSSVFMLLTGQPEALLPTIVSRCQRIVLSGDQEPLPERWQDALVGILRTDSSSVVSAHSNAKRLADLLKEIKTVVSDEIADAAQEGDTKEVLDARIGGRYRELRGALLRDMVLWYRDILVHINGGSDGDLHFRDHSPEIRRMASESSGANALRMVSAVETMKEQLEKNLSEVSVLNLGFSRLCLDKHEHLQDSA